MRRIQIEQIKKKLEVKRQETMEFLGQMEKETRSLEVDSPQDSADRCVVSMSKESLFECSSQRRTVLRLIDAALGRVADGTFGVCITCGEDIQKQRLQAVPWTQFCLRCQEAIEEEVESSVSARMPPQAAFTALRRAG